MSDSVVSALRQATQGLLFPSEKDAPFKVVTLAGDGDVSRANIAQLTGQPIDVPVAEEKFERLFGELCQEQKWHGEAEKTNVKKFQHLRDIIKGQLTHVQVFKIGQAQLKVFIVGKTPKNHWVALETEALET